MSDNINGAVVRWTQAARRHRIGKASARHVMQSVEPARVTTNSGVSAWQWIGVDERGRELEIIAVAIDPPGAEPYVLVIHVMPTRLRG